MVRRILLISALLVASHGTALWLGARRQTQEETATRPVAVPEKAASVRPTLYALIQAGHELAARREAEEKIDIEAEVALARAKLSPDADFRAILESGITSLSGDFPPETRAALGAWLDRDPLAALNWVSGFYREYRSVGFNEELEGYFRRGGVERLQEFLGKEPRIREYLLERAGSCFEAGDEERVLQVAATLKSSTDRRALLDGGFRSEGLAGHLASIRGLLDQKEADKFLKSVGGWWNPELLDEVRRAGFSEEAVQRFEEETREDPPSKEERSSIDAIPNNPNRVGQEVTWESLIQRNANIIYRIPELPSAIGGTGSLESFGPQDPSDGSDNGPVTPELQEEIRGRFELLRQGRVSPAELVSWLREVGPPGPSMERTAVRILLAHGLSSDPVNILSWLKESRSDWRGLMDSADWTDLPPEALADLAGDYPDDGGETARFHVALERSFQEWFSSDPDACLLEIEKMPQGALKDRLLNLGKKEEAE